MEKEDIEYYLSLLGEQLQELGLRTPIRLLMIGGGFMLTQTGSRRTTNDVDVLVKDISYPQYSDDYRVFKNAVRFVSYDTGIHQAWLSDTISDFLTSAGPVPKGKLWRKFGPLLHVYVPSKSYILAHKLLAGRRKDFEDINALLKELHIQDRRQAQRIINRYITNKDIQQSHNVEATLNTFFPTL